MGESEGRSITSAFSTQLVVEKQPDSRPRAHPIMMRLNPPPRWKGTATEFACTVRDDWHNGKIPNAKTLNAALKEKCKHCFQSDGTPFNVKSLSELLRKRDNKLRGNPL
jgi:hypothetical protein